MAISFERDVLPLFTAPEISCMRSKGVLLDSYDWMKIPANAELVHEHLTGNISPRMPLGGPYWPDADIADFAAWIAGGYQP